MAFDRTERFIKRATSTSARIGPGIYDISVLSKPTRDPDNAYPFLSGTSRQILSIPKDSHKFPGPDCYNIEGGVSIDYTDVRFKEKVHEGPGPTEYTLSDDLFKKTSRKIKPYPSTWRGSADKLWLRPPRLLMYTTRLPIPSKRDVDRYDYDERSIFMKNSVIEHKPTDFYDVPRGETNFTTLKYKGNFWSRMKGRDDERTSVTPGPGDYEHETKKSLAQIHNERTREAKRAVAKQPRFLEALCQQKLRQNFPAPNHYDLSKSVFDKYKYIPYKCDRHMTKPLSFDRTAKRFIETFEWDTPGPGKYEIATRQICYGSILHAPFGTFSSRFKKIIDVTTPGPADYHTEVGNLSFESIKRFKNKYPKMFDYLKFYKILTSLNGDDECIELIDERKVTDEGKCSVYHAVFKSKVDRFPKLRKNDDVPDPGAYEALSAFKTNRDKCDFLCRQLIPPFGSRACRFPTILKDDFHVPGPAHYNLSGDISKNIKSGVICYAPRERKEDIKGPGPLHYHIHPYIASSVLKKSFNVTLNKSKNIKTINEIQTPWQYRRSKKVLRCFAVSRKRYQHCTSNIN